MSCPTLYVSHLSLYGPSTSTYLFEFDSRFHALSKPIGTQFFKYDFNRPEKVLEKLKGKVDLLVIDPPFLNETTNQLYGETSRLLLRKEDGKVEGKVLLLTGVSIGEKALKYYQNGEDGEKMKLTKLKVEHSSPLANDFNAWADFDGAENWGEEEL